MQNIYMAVTEGTIICAALLVSKIDDTHVCAEHYRCAIENIKVCAEHLSLYHSAEHLSLCHGEYQGLFRTLIVVSQRTSRSLQNTYLCVTVQNTYRCFTENIRVCAEHLSLCHREHQGLCRALIVMSQRTSRSLQNTYRCVTVQNTYRCVTENTKVCAEHLSLCHREHQGLCRTFSAVESGVTLYCSSVFTPPPSTAGYM